jgi:tripartite-type tricarboxylate transporter receptor subunit TctC
MAVAAPPGTPKEVTQRLSDAIGTGFKAADLRKRILSLEAEPLGNSPDGMRKMIEASTRHWAPVISAAKITLD